MPQAVKLTKPWQPTMDTSSNAYILPAIDAVFYLLTFFLLLVVPVFRTVAGLAVFFMSGWVFLPPVGVLAVCFIAFFFGIIRGKSGGGKSYVGVMRPEKSVEPTVLLVVRFFGIAGTEVGVASAAG